MTDSHDRRHTINTLIDTRTRQIRMSAIRKRKYTDAINIIY